MSSNDLSLNNIFHEKVKINTKKNKKLDECHELKNIAYKTMLLNGNNINPSINTLDDTIINNFLENESQANKIEIWIKLDKTQKIKKLYNYCDDILKNKYNLSNNEINDIKKYLIKCIDRKNLLKCKEVSYCNIDKTIKNIPNLYFNDETRNFILKKDDKHVSTVKSLPSDKRNKPKTIKVHE